MRQTGSVDVMQSTLREAIEPRSEVLMTRRAAAKKLFRFVTVVQGYFQTAKLKIPHN
jgi:hypothetical protein